MTEPQTIPQSGLRQWRSLLQKMPHGLQKIPHRHRAGFSLLELMITLLTLAIILTLAVPSFQQMVNNNRLTTQANALQSSFTLARSEAVRRGQPVTVVAEASGFGDGWCVYVGESGDDCNNTTRIRQVEGSDQLVWVDNGTTSVTFNDQGERLTPGPGTNIQIQVHPKNCTAGEAPGSRRISVTMAGRASIVEGDCP